MISVTELITPAPAAEPTSPGLGSGEVAELAGVSLRQLQWWDEQRLISPEHVGHRRIYTQRQAVEVCVVAALRRRAVTWRRVRRTLTKFRPHRTRTIFGSVDLFLVLLGDIPTLVTSRAELIQLIAESGTTIVCLDLAKVVEKVVNAERKPVISERRDPLRARYGI